MNKWEEGNTKMTVIAFNYAVKPIGSLGIVNLNLLQSQLKPTDREGKQAWINGEEGKTKMTPIAVNYAVKPIGSLVYYVIVNLILLQSLTQTYRQKQIAWLDGDNIKCLLVISVVW